MKFEDALAIYSAENSLDIFDERYQEDGERFFCEFFDAFVKETIRIEENNLNRDKFEYIPFVAQSNDEIDEKDDNYFSQPAPTPLLKVVVWTYFEGQYQAEFYYFLISRKQKVLSCLHKVEDDENIY